MLTIIVEVWDVVAFMKKLVVKNHFNLLIHVSEKTFPE
jgi:hypothetical protein